MNYLKSLPIRISSFSKTPSVNLISKRFRRTSPCDLNPPDKKPCFDLSKVQIQRGNPCHTKFIRSFLYTHYWPREPSIVSLWMDLNSPYLDVLTDKYANSGDRFVAYETIKRTGEQKMIGVSVSNKIYPWAINELEEWAHFTLTKAERNRMYFSAHCLKSPDLFKKYNVDYLYEVEVIATAAEVTGQGLGTLLLNTALSHAQDLRHPLVQVIAVSHYTAKICEKCGMKREWAMDYSDFVDISGQRVFFPRRPHHTVAIYIKQFDPKVGAPLPCKPPIF